MYEVYSLTLVDFLEVGDLIQFEGLIYLVDSCEYRESDDLWEIVGVEQEWEEPATFFIPDGHMVELVIWAEEE